jgi:hypothetical protein
MIDLNEWKRENREDKKVEIIGWILIILAVCFGIILGVILFNLLIDYLLTIKEINLWKN